MDMVRSEQRRHRDHERESLSAAKWNFWPGIGLLILFWLPYHIGTALWIIGVLLCAIGTWQWFNALCDRRAARLNYSPFALPSS
jgi:hypothetical protein